MGPPTGVVHGLARGCRSHLCHCGGNGFRSAVARSILRAVLTTWCVRHSVAFVSQHREALNEHSSVELARGSDVPEPLDYAAPGAKRPLIRQPVLWLLFAVLVFALLVIVFAPVAPAAEAARDLDQPLAWCVRRIVAIKPRGAPATRYTSPIVGPSVSPLRRMAGTSRSGAPAGEPCPRRPASRTPLTWSMNRGFTAATSWASAKRVSNSLGILDARGAGTV